MVCLGASGGKNGILQKAPGAIFIQCQAMILTRNAERRVPCFFDRMDTEADRKYDDKPS